MTRYEHLSRVSSVITKLEIYAIVLVVLALGFVGAYCKGRLDEKTAITRKQLADNTTAMQDWIAKSQSLATADDVAAQRTRELLAAVDTGLANVHEKFAKLPSVVVDARGCERLTAAARLRWNAVELLSPAPVAGEPVVGAVSSDNVPPAR